MKTLIHELQQRAALSSPFRLNHVFNLQFSQHYARMIRITNREYKREANANSEINFHSFFMKGEIFLEFSQREQRDYVLLYHNAIKLLVRPPSLYQIYLSQNGITSHLEFHFANRISREFARKLSTELNRSFSL